MADTKKPNVGEAILGKNKQAIGSYQEAPGGGTPLKAGEKAPSKEWVAANRKMQPRDDDGKFTYNAANAKPLEYGPSRGKTVPPFLRGVKLTYVEKSDVIMTEEGKRVLAGIDMSVEELINNYRNYSKQEGGFRNLTKETKGKTGAYSQKEKAAKEIGYEGLLKALTAEEILNEFKKRNESGDLKGNFKYAKKEEKKPEVKEASVTELEKSGNPDVELAKKGAKELFTQSKAARDLYQYASDNGVKLSPYGVADRVAIGISYEDIKADITKEIERKKSENA